jgi:hypothetical protein
VTRSWPEHDRVLERLDVIVSRLPGVQSEDSYGHRSYLLKGKRIAWLLVDELVEQAWRMTAGKRAVAAFDAEQGDAVEGPNG